MLNTECPLNTGVAVIHVDPLRYLSIAKPKVI